MLYGKNIKMNDDDFNGMMKIILIIFGVLLFVIVMLVGIIIFKDSITINNYISSGNYTFDIGENMLNAINLTSVN